MDRATGLRVGARTPVTQTRHSRRQFLQAAGGLGVCAASVAVLSGCGIQGPQPPKVVRIGYLSKADSHSAPYFEAFRRELRELGWVEGQNLAIEFRLGEEKSLAELAGELVALKVDVIVARCTPETKAAKQATSTIPIVMLALTGDPIGTGVVDSLSRPGGNVTGLTILAPELTGKRVELLKEAIPKVSRTAVLWNAAIPESSVDLREMQVTARALNVEFQLAEVQGAGDFDGAFDAVSRTGADALTTLLGTLGTTHQTQITEFAAKSRLPAMYEVREFVEVGGLMSYGPSLADLYRRAAAYVDKIVKGAKPADLPVERPTWFELVVNLNTAQALGLTLPQSFVMHADELIQ
jgi:putative ABC transport system substrate-binding protein